MPAKAKQHVLSFTGTTCASAQKARLSTGSYAPLGAAKQSTAVGQTLTGSPASDQLGDDTQMGILYGWKEGFRLAHKMDANKVEAELAKLRKRADYGPEAVWRYAKAHKKSELHAGFDWDLTAQEALEQCWYERARYIMRHTVMIEIENVVIKQPARSEVFNEHKRTWAHVPDELTTEDGRRQLLAQALRELREFKNKYARLVELADLISEIERTLHEAGRKVSAKPRNKAPRRFVRKGQGRSKGRRGSRPRPSA